MTEFADRILAWFDVHGRKDLPWQQPQDPYRTWVSEIMLQQTQVQTVIPYFERFMQSFPDVRALADAPRDEVLQHWSGLGYYARARNLHRAAQIIRDDHDGVFPGTLEGVIALPGIGRSTAGAILSLALNQRHPILDGNVKRLLARHEAIDGWPGQAAVAQKLWDIAERNTPHARVADYTQAIMDLGATLCTRGNPACERCPVASDCKALDLNKVSDTTRTGLKVSVTQFPGRKPKKEKPLRTTTMVLASHDGHIYLERRPEPGIWGGLWSLPEVNDSGVEDWCRDRLKSEPRELESWQVLRHSFSHYDLDIQPILVRIESALRKVADCDDARWHQLDEDPPGGMAAPVSKLIEQLRNGTHS